jgi:hypothetical protein
MISDRALRRLAHHLDVFPPFLDLLQAFGERTSSDSDSVGGHRSYTRGQAFGKCHSKLSGPAWRPSKTQLERH